ncbi:MAG TPA: T9SS type A sorting domain-containing protein [Bacteroidia bacterium]|nr:T9SS type A sorting domain-containing protein [Bacteroidia bacterium]
MKKIILGIFFLPILVQGQTLQGSAFPTAGSVKTLILSDTTGVQAGNAGSGITWNFSSLTNSGQLQTDSFFIPSATPYGTTFPTATIAEHETYPGTDYYIYFKDDGSEFQRIGNVQPDTVIYYDPANEFTYPENYGSSNNDTYFASYYVSGNLAHMRGTVSNTADGSGTLTLPTGTYTNVIRVKSLRNEKDTIFASTQITGILTQTIYNWYQSSLYYPLLSITTTNVQFNFGSPVNSKTVGYRQGTTGIDNLNNSISFINVYPNPANENIQIHYSLKQSENVTFELVDVLGRVVKKPLSETQTTGSYKFNLDVKNLPNGLYFLKSNTGVSQKIIVNH